MLAFILSTTILFNLPSYSTLINSDSIEERFAIIDDLWSNGVVPYEYAADYVDRQFEKGIIEGIMTEIRQLTCIRFVPRSVESGRFFLSITGVRMGCTATVGQVDDAQLNLHPWTSDEEPGCFVSDDIIRHELMHVLGFLHEHQNPLSREYIDINYDNLDPGKKRSFKVIESDDLQTMSGREIDSYDPKSIMHYHARMFAKKSATGPVIVARNPAVKIRTADDFGYTESDLFKVNKLYNCFKRIIQKTSARLQRNCCCYMFLQNIIQSDNGCLDYHPNCKVYVSNNYCNNYPALSKKYCKKTCFEDNPPEPEISV